MPSTRRCVTGLTPTARTRTRISSALRSWLGQLTQLPRRGLRQEINQGRRDPPGKVTSSVLPPQRHEAKCCVIKSERPASVSFHLGDARRSLRRYYSAAIGQTPVAFYYETRNYETRSALPGLPGKLARGFPGAGGLCLNQIEFLTIPFLRFPRVHQQTRGNFFCPFFGFKPSSLDR